MGEPGGGEQGRTVVGGGVTGGVTEAETGKMPKVEVKMTEAVGGRELKWFAREEGSGLKTVAVLKCNSDSRILKSGGTRVTEEVAKRVEEVAREGKRVVVTGVGREMVDLWRDGDVCAIDDKGEVRVSGERLKRAVLGLDDEMVGWVEEGKSGGKRIKVPVVGENGDLVIISCKEDEYVKLRAQYDRMYVFGNFRRGVRVYTGEKYRKKESGRGWMEEERANGVLELMDGEGRHKRVEVKVGTVDGKREINQDAVMAEAFGVTVDGKREVWGVVVLCDGMGGEARGERVAGRACLGVHGAAVSMAEESLNGGDRVRLIEYVAGQMWEGMEMQVKAAEALDRGGTTGVMLVISPDGSGMRLHAGDSRLYLGRQSLTVDHSHARGLYDAKEYKDVDELRQSPYFNVIYRPVGGEGGPDRGMVHVGKGAELTMVTDGVWGVVGDVLGKDGWEGSMLEEGRLVALASGLFASDNATAVEIHALD